MKHILLIIPYGSVGGMERLAWSFYNHYITKGYTVKALKIIKLENDIINFGNDELHLKSKDFNSMSRFERFNFYITAPYKIRKIINKYRITHSISFGDMTNFFSSLTCTNEFKIGSIHALKSVEFTNKSLFNTIFKLSYKTTYRKLDKVVCISKDIKQDIIENCGFKFVNKLKVIYNPHNLDEINRLSKLPIANKNELQLFSGNSILFLGRLSIQKSPWHLVKAFSLVLKTIPTAKLIFIGDGDATVEQYLKELIIELKISNTIFFLGRKSNPYHYLAMAKVLALSSHYEGTPNVIVESICVGTPVVSSFCTKGITELMGLLDYEDVNENIEMEAGIVTPNLFIGKLGVPNAYNLLVEEEKLAEALLSILTSSRHKQRIEYNRDVLLSKFDIVKVTKQYLENNK
jgi:glycosyltransferase involved in cell wall biosynthesis